MLHQASHLEDKDQSMPVMWSSSWKSSSPSGRPQRLAMRFRHTMPHGANNLCSATTCGLRFTATPLRPHGTDARSVDVLPDPRVWPSLRARGGFERQGHGRRQAGPSQGLTRVTERTGRSFNTNYRPPSDRFKEFWCDCLSSRSSVDDFNSRLDAVISSAGNFCSGAWSRSAAAGETSAPRPYSRAPGTRPLPPLSPAGTGRPPGQCRPKK